METNWKQPGYVLKERYRFGEVLGEGGYGITYRGYDLLKQESVAVKELKGSVEENYLTVMQKLQQMGKIPGMVQIKEILTEDNVIYVVMEYIEGLNGVELLNAKGRQTQAQTAEIMTPVIAALQYLHNQGMLHRDISTDNIIIDKNGKGTLVDFGSVCMDIEGEDVAEIKSVKQGFSPEEFYYENGKIGTWSDVYEACATMYHLLTGVVPIPAVERGQGKRLESLQEKNVSLIPIYAEAIKNGLLLDYRERLDNMQVLKQAMDMVEDTPETDSTKEEPPIQEKKPPYVAAETMRTLDGKKAAQVKEPEIPVAPVAPVEIDSKKGKKKRKLIALGIIAALLVVLGISIGIYVHTNNQEDNEKEADAKEEAYEDNLKKYKQACEMLETRSDVDTAVEMLEELGDFQDSYEHLYEVATEYQNYGYNEKAADIYMYLGDADYSDSIEQLFLIADGDVNDKNYEHARTLYEYLEKSEDQDGFSGKDGILRCDFNQAYQDKYQKEDYAAAKKSFEALGDFYSDDYEVSSEKMVEMCDYSAAVQTVEEEDFDNYEDAKEVLLDNKDYATIRTMAQKYYDNMMYTEAMEIYKLLDKETSTSYEGQIRDCEANQGVQVKYANYDKETSKSYDSGSGTMVKYVDMETAEYYLKGIYNTYTSEDEKTMDLTKLEINGEKYGIKDIVIDTKKDLKITANIYKLSDTSQKSIALNYEANMPYTYTDENGSSYETTVNQLTVDGKLYMFK